MQSSRNATSDGPVWAAILAAAIGCASFGLLVDLAQASKACSGWLNFFKPSGDLSGKSTVAVALWLLAWGILHFCWRGKNVSSPRWIMRISIMLILLGLLTTFPPLFSLLG